MATSEFTTEELESEEWRDVVGYEGRYSVSSLGRIRNAKLKIIRSHWCRDRRVITLSRGSRYLRATFQVHCLVVYAFIGPRPTNYQINHKDGHPANNKLDNLEYVTASENLRHAIALGLKTVPTADNRGERCATSKLITAQVLAIREMQRQGVCQERIAEAYGVVPQTINKIIKRETWKHI